MVLALTLTLVLVLTLALAPSGMISKKGVPKFCPSTVVVVVVVVAAKIRNVRTKNSKTSKNWGRIWDGLGMLWGRFRNVFETISDRR